MNLWQCVRETFFVTQQKFRKEQAAGAVGSAGGATRACGQNAFVLQVDPREKLSVDNRCCRSEACTGAEVSTAPQVIYLGP